MFTRCDTPAAYLCAEFPIDIGGFTEASPARRYHFRPPRGVSKPGWIIEAQAGAQIVDKLEAEAHRTANPAATSSPTGRLSAAVSIRPSST